MTIYRWVKKFSIYLIENLPDTVNNETRYEDIEINEMWTFTGKKKENAGFGLHIVEKQEKL